MRIVGIVALTLFCALSSALLWVYYKRSTAPSYRITLPTILGPSSELDTDSIRGKGVYVINVFASWCATCLAEHAIWMNIAANSKVDIYGVAYLDVVQKTLTWLEKHGNPYVLVATDNSGESLKRLGVTGVPETFVFDQNGKMVMHVTGAMTVSLWQQISALILTNPEAAR
ncbi:MAG: redoxin family protein [Anaplasma sp.]